MKNTPILKSPEGRYKNIQSNFFKNKLSCDVTASIGTDFVLEANKIFHAHQVLPVLNNIISTKNKFPDIKKNQMGGIKINGNSLKEMNKAMIQQ